jgi:hypothetical protein
VTTQVSVQRTEAKLRHRPNSVTECHKLRYRCLFRPINCRATAPPLLAKALRVGALSYILKNDMTREEFVLAAMTPEAGYSYSPVQVQKLLFLLERQIPGALNGPHFHFQAYHYGPFDSAVYHQLEQLAARGLVLIDRSSSPRSFVLTAEGAAIGNRALDALPPQTREFIVRTCHFVRAQSFSSLVSAIYKAFPEMRVNSVFQS